MSPGWVNGRCAVCSGFCDGSLMRMQSKRTREMIEAPEVPRMKNGNIALCHHCQRRVYFAGGFTDLLASHLQQIAEVGYVYKLGRR